MKGFIRFSFFLAVFGGFAYWYIFHRTIMTYNIELSAEVAEEIDSNQDTIILLPADGGKFNLKQQCADKGFNLYKGVTKALHLAKGDVEKIQVRIDQTPSGTSTCTFVSLQEIEGT